MVHNAIEYALMASYAEGLNILAHANVGARTQADRSRTDRPLANHWRTIARRTRSFAVIAESGPQQPNIDARMAMTESSRAGMLDDVRLVVADVDGTLVTPDKILTLRARSVVRRVIEAGIGFTITSGRPPRGMKMLIDELQLEDPITAFNGGLVVRPDLSIIREHLVPATDAQAVIDVLTSSHRTDRDHRRHADLRAQTA